jgi:hypothetical protein
MKIDIQQILKYAQMGWHIFPCLPGQKQPAVKWGTQSTIDLDTIREWWRRWPMANVAVDAGKSNLYIVDADGPQGIAEWELIASAGAFPPLPTQKTGGGGLQIFFKNPAGLRNTTKALAPHIDTRGAGGYCFIPPSIHPSGNVYKWIIPPEMLHLSDFPDWLTPPKNYQEPPQEEIQRPAREGAIPDGNHWLTKALERTGAGKRNHVGFWLACMLRDDELDLQQAAPIMAEYQRAVSGLGNHPYEWQEALNTLRAAYRGAKRQPARGVYKLCKIPR